jgi:hypothetical protein
MDEPRFRAEKAPGSWRRIIGREYWVAPEDLGALRGEKMILNILCIYSENLLSIVE